MADVSNNGGISSFDAAEIANFVVSGSPVGIAGTWKFSPLSRSYPSVNSSLTGEDYSALLMGEVSGNWLNTGARPVGSGVRQLADAEGSGISEQSISVDLPSLVTPADNEVLIPVTVEGVANKGIISCEFDLRYDPLVIQPQEKPVDVAGTVGRGLSVVANADEPGLLRVVMYGAMPIDGNGLLLNLKFSAVGAAGAVSPLTWERIMFNEGDLETFVTNGRIEIF